MATNKQALTHKKLEELGVVSVDFNNKIVTRYNARGTKLLSTNATVSKQKNSKINEDKISYIHYICCIRGKTYSFSNIVYAWYVGPIPSGFLIDHINGNTEDNNPDNLRLYT